MNLTKLSLMRILFNLIFYYFFAYFSLQSTFKSFQLSYTSPPVWKTTSLRWCHLWTTQACLPWQPPFLQHISWRCCNPPDILSSMMEILLFNSVFYNGVNPVSVLTLKLLLGVIGVVTTETPSISYTFHLYIRLVVTL